MRRLAKYVTSRKVRKAILTNIKICFTVLAVLILLPIAFPWAMIDFEIKNRQKQAAAAKFSCTECGIILGERGLQLADIQFQEYADRLHAENPDWRFRIVRSIQAICHNCGAEFTYLEQAQTFEKGQLKNTCQFLPNSDKS
jgi:hypothetical protein